VAVRRFLAGVWAWLNRWFHWIALAGVVVGLALAVRSQWDAIVELDWEGSWPILLGSAALFAVAPLAQASTSWIILRLLGAQAPFGEAMRIWANAYVLRYAPSGALAIVVRIRGRERLAATRDQVYVATAYEQLAAIVAGAIVSIVCFLAAGLEPHWLTFVIGLPALAVAIALRPGFFGGLLHRLLERRGLDVPRILRGRELTIAIGVNAAGWLATGAGVFVLVDGMESTKDAGFLWLTAVYALAWLVGFVVPALPGGLGARDGMLVALLATRFGAGVGSVLAITVRLANTLGEFVAIGLVEAVYLVRKKTGPAAVPR
jgi:hypothetical protein